MPLLGTAASQNIKSFLQILGVYFAGGYAASNSAVLSRIDKVTTSSDTTSTLSATLTNPTTQMAAASNHGVAAYFAGGSGTWVYSATVSRIDKLTFSGEAKSTLAETLSSTIAALGGAASTTAAYFAGGYSPSTNAVSRIDKIAFTNDAKTTLGATLSTAIYGLTGTESTTAGYFLGGNAGSYTNRIDKLTFSGETTSTLAATLTYIVSTGAAASNSTAAYHAGGYAYTPGATSINLIDKITFSGDTKSTLSATLSVAINGLGGGASATAAYFNGGESTAVDKLTFSTETRTTLAATLIGAGQVTATANRGG